MSYYHRDLEYIVKIANSDNEMCSCCGTVFSWWLTQPRKSIFHACTDEFFCSFKCLRESNQHLSPYTRYYGELLNQPQKDKPNDQR